MVGPSGCGKSSLVRAGVASRLRRAGRSVAVFTPGSDPLAALVAALETAGPTTVLVIDQLEELFAPDVASDAADQFLDDLVARLEIAPVVVALRGRPRRLRQQRTRTSPAGSRPASTSSRR